MLCPLKFGAENKIFSGGTWESYPKDYREQVMNEIFWAANTYNNDRPMKKLKE
jgi:histone acetyltransferase (RNA polymerase elongator complex component)